MTVFLQHDLHEIWPEGGSWSGAAPGAVANDREGICRTRLVAGLELAFGQVEIDLAEAQQRKVLVTENMRLAIDGAGGIAADIGITPVLHAIVTGAGLTGLVSCPEI